jgi:vitamin B12 transport system permease protein
MPRTLAVLLVGAALAVCGVVMQALFNNPLAEPGLLGVSNGAGIGLVLGVMLGNGSLWSLALAAMAGALLITLMLLHFAHKQLSMSRLLLTGVALGIICSAIMTWAVYFSTSLDLRQLMYWMMGGFSGIDWRYGGMMLALLPVTLLLIATARTLNLLALGETSARQLGLPLLLWRNLLVLAMGWLVGVSVAMAGAIGFVGLVIPHLLRLSGFSDHRYLLPAAALAGAAVLLGADIIARLVLTSAELPIGVVTATLGAPLFIVLLVKSSR